MSGGQLTVPLVLRTQGGAGYRGGGAALAEPRELAHARARPQGRDAEPPERRGRAARERDRRPEPRRLHREQDALLPQGRGARAGRRRCRSARPSTLREGRDVTIVALSRLVHDALAAAERLRRGRHRGRGDRPAHARAARPRRDRRVRRAHRPARRRARGRRARRLRRRDRGAGPGARPSTTSTRRSRASARRSRRSRSARRSRTPTCRAPTRSSRPCAAMLISPLSGA